MHQLSFSQSLSSSLQNIIIRFGNTTNGSNDEDKVKDRNGGINNKFDRRLSMIMNEDDYDFAVELRPDDEYRQVAEALPSIIDFDEIHSIDSNIQYNKDNTSKQTLNEELSASVTNTRSFRPFSSFIEDGNRDIETNNKTMNKRESNANIHNIQPFTNEFYYEDEDFLDRRMSLFDQSMVQHHKIDEDDELNQQAEMRSEHLDLPFDSSITGLGTSPYNQDGVGTWGNIIGKTEFSFRLGLLEKHKKWVEKAARRSTLGFRRNHNITNDKQAMDKFLVMLTKGIHIRRHQSNHIAEIVCLYSIDGCRTIQWKRPSPEDLKSQRIRQGQKYGKSSAVYESNFDKTAFDCCIAICGCGDDLIAGQDYAHHRRHSSIQLQELGRDQSNNLQNEGDYVGFGRCFHNFGYKRFGKFSDLDIVALHPATKEDPTEIGFYGTQSLRRSNDTYNQDLTFSLIVKDSNTSQGFQSVDIECETEEDYFSLLHGFKLLKDDVDNSKMDQNQSPQIDKISELWNGAKKAIGSNLPSINKSSNNNDPLAALFEPVGNIDPLRAIRVGGGLISADINRRASFTNSPGFSPGSKHMISPQRGILPPARFLGWNSAGTQIWARLKMAGMDVKCVYSWDLSRIILKIRCPTWRLEEMAEQMHLKIRSRGGHLKPFKVSRRGTFLSLGGNGAIFRSSERQQIIDYIIRSKIKDGGAELDENTKLGKQIVQRFPLHMYSKLITIRHAWVTFWKREQHGNVAEGWSPFSVSYATSYKLMNDSVNHFFENLMIQPLDSVAEYFGESVAFYFAFMSFYTRWLVFPSILGFIVFCVQMQTRTLDHWLCTFYSIIIMIWASFMFAFWRQKSSALAYRWGVLDYEVEETERPQFRGTKTYDETSGEIRKTYSLWKRVGRYIVSVPVISCAILITLVIMCTVFYSQDMLYNDYIDGKRISFKPAFPDWNIIIHRQSSSINNQNIIIQSFNVTSNTTTEAVQQSPDSLWGRQITMTDLLDSRFWAATFFYPCLYGIIVSLLNIGFNLIAICLNEFENHRTQTTYANRLILKVFSFEFVTVFTCLYYYAFCMKDAEGAFNRISITIFSLMTVGQWWNIFLSICLPSLYQRALLYRMKSDYNKTNRKVYRAMEYSDNCSVEQKRRFQEQIDKRIQYLNDARSKCWEEALQAKYNSVSDYNSMAIQIALILFFSGVFTLAPLIALLNNLLLIRFNAYKICYVHQRPVAYKTSGLGVWEDVLQILSVGGLLTSCAIMGVTSTYWLHSSIPRIPPAVQRAQTRERKSINRRSISRKNEKIANNNNSSNNIMRHNNGYHDEDDDNRRYSLMDLQSHMDREGVDLKNDPIGVVREDLKNDDNNVNNYEESHLLNSEEMLSTRLFHDNIPNSDDEDEDDDYEDYRWIDEGEEESACGLAENVEEDFSQQHDELQELPKRKSILRSNHISRPQLVILPAGQEYEHNIVDTNNNHNSDYFVRRRNSNNNNRRDVSLVSGVMLERSQQTHHHNNKTLSSHPIKSTAQENNPKLANIQKNHNNNNNNNNNKLYSSPPWMNNKGVSNNMITNSNDKKSKKSPASGTHSTTGNYLLMSNKLLKSQPKIIINSNQIINNNHKNKSELFSFSVDQTNKRSPIDILTNTPDTRVTRDKDRTPQNDLNNRSTALFNNNQSVRELAKRFQ
eukprot:gene4369-6181_t